ncbi:MAG: hypothetical protein KDC76_14560 [Bacteroidetes bacterium]|nr:hypothetical protein [Bacteroidota bacterium]
MIQVELIGYRRDFLKISLTKLIMEHTGISLTNAHAIVHSMMDGKRAVVLLRDLESTVNFIREADRLGVQCSRHKI